MLWYGLGGGEGVKYVEIPFHLIKKQLTSIRQIAFLTFPTFHFKSS